MSELISYKKICKIALPVTISQASIILNGMIDLAFLGGFGTDIIAAASICNITSSTIYNFLEGIRTATTIMISKANAEKAKRNMSSILNVSLVNALIIGIIVALITPFFSKLLYSLLSTEDVAVYGVKYMTIWLSAAPFTLIFYAGVGFFRGLGDTVTPLYITIFNFLVNFIGDIVFVKLGFGANGIAAATLISYIIGSIVTLITLKVKKSTRDYFRLKESIKGKVKEYVALSFQIGFNTGFMNMALMFFVSIMSTQGTEIVAAHQIAFQVFLITYLPAMGFLVSASILVPQLLALQKKKLIGATVFRIVKVSFLFVLIISAIVYTFSNNIAAFFSPNDLVVVERASEALKIVSVIQLSTSIYMVIRGALTGCKDTKFMMYEGIISGYLIFLILAYIFVCKMNYGIKGGYYAFLIWALSDCIFFISRFLYINKKKFQKQ